MTSPFRVCGHVRSGNHYVAALLHRALCPDLPGAEFDNSGTGHWSQRDGAARFEIDGAETGGRVVMPYRGVLGDHRFPLDREAVLRDARRVVYVIRDGRDVALSCWRWPKIRPAALGADVKLGAYVRAPVDWRGTPGERWMPPHPGYGLFDHWRDHVDAWARCVGVILVHYEAAVLRPATVVADMADALGMRPTGGWSVPGPTGWNPSPTARGKVGAWRTEMGRSLQRHFDRVVPAGHVGRWEQ